MKITILGAGSFGTAIAVHLAAIGNEVLLWTNDEVQCKSINETRTNSFCFQDVILSDKISCTLDLNEALDFSERVIMAIPTQIERSVFRQIAQTGKKQIRLLNLAKGIEISTGELLHVVAKEECPDIIFSVLSGPSHAEEVMFEAPTAVSIASFVEGESETWQSIVSGGLFRAYTTDDVIGLEVGGAVKNIYAVAAGIVKAMSFGDNAVAALACRGLAEMMRLGVKLGAKPMTLSGLAGVGDLMVTCYSEHSRNFRLGRAIGAGKSFDDAVRSIGQVAEGAYTVRAVVENSIKFEVEMPLAEGVYDVLYKNTPPKDLLGRFFSRPLKAETNF